MCTTPKVNTQGGVATRTQGNSHQRSRTLSKRQQNFMSKHSNLLPLLLCSTKLMTAINHQNKQRNQNIWPKMRKLVFSRIGQCIRVQILGCLINLLISIWHMSDMIFEKFLWINNYVCTCSLDIIWNIWLDSWWFIIRFVHQIRQTNGFITYYGGRCEIMSIPISQSKCMYFVIIFKRYSLIKKHNLPEQLRSF